ncbi:metalloprotease [Xylaria intraflava]|nr:metalloprotease [Xylaria intraflava]
MMQFKSLVTAFLLARASAQFSGPRACGTLPPTEDQIAEASAMLDQERIAMSNGTDGRAAFGYTVDTYFHVIAASKSLSDGYLTQTMLDDQLKALNKAYNPHDISFRLIKSDWTVNANWSSDGDPHAMKSALRKGTYADLNVYFINTLGKLLGYCTFPTTRDSHLPGSDNFINDGCSVLAQSVPGGTAAPYNLGGTAVHEVGHWMGLFHTFEGSCSSAGDYVDDTPPEDSPAAGCPVGRDSCPGNGVDPIHNYMDYTDDSCYEEFTLGQQARMYSVWEAYRA